MSGFLDDIPEVDLPGSARLRPGKPGGGRPKRALRLRTVKPRVKQTVINTGDEIQTIIWHVIKCPKCNSAHVPVYSTQRPIRYHKCTDCGECFKSVEQ